MTDTASKAAAIYYFHGDAATYTGGTQIKHGATLYECILTEGHRKGETIWTYTAPRPDAQAELYGETSPGDCEIADADCE